MKISYSIIIPVFNEELNLEFLYTRLTKVMQGIGKDYEIIFIDDGSTDNSFQVLQHLHESDSGVKVIRFTRNFGQHPAVMAGFDLAQGEVMITLDADLQNPPEEIPKLLKKLEEGYEVVSGYRSNRKDPLWRKTLSRFSSWLISKITGVKLRDYGCMLRVYCKQAVDMLKLSKEHSCYITALVSWTGVSIAEVEVAHNSRFAGKSKYNIINMLKIYYDLITGFTMLPIRFVTYIGFIFSLAGFVIGVYLLVWRILYGAGIGGLISFVMLGFFFFGILLFSIGLIGEYIARIFIEVRGRPYYIIREVYK